MTSDPRAKRHKTALERTELSRPVRQAIHDGVLRTEHSIFDYGCGRGGDVKRLTDLGHQALGWDPVHAPNTPIRSADVVNLGYVVNVVEDSDERKATLCKAWALSEKLLVVSARLKDEYRRCLSARAYEDGVLTGTGTFQKFYSQTELIQWVSDTISVAGVAAAPGVVYIFRDEAERERFLLRRYGSRSRQPRKRLSLERYERHQGLLAPLSDFFLSRGRLPVADEIEASDEICVTFGSIPRAFSLIKRVSDPTEWDSVAQEKRSDLLVYLALGRLSGRPPITKLPLELQRDIRAHFGAYTKACSEADQLLFSAGNKKTVDDACRSSKVGKNTPRALYVHVNSLTQLSPVLRVYEGCAHTFLGTVEDANVIKLHRIKSQVSYLSYPTFENDPHPRAHDTVVANLEESRIHYRRYSESDNPPILHRKEEMVSESHPGRGKWERLTAQEEAHGLYADTDTIGFAKAWSALLESKGLYHRGHRLCRRKPPAELRQNS